MKKISIFIIALVIIVAGFVLFRNPSTKTDTNKNDKVVAVIYKSPTCGCCGVYASYMGKKGYDVQIENVPDQGLEEVKQNLGVPNELYSCHTTEVGGYIVEGHVPEEAIQKLLAEKPDIKGIGMAGMPAGSPGMPGPKTDSFIVYKINQDGTQGSVFMTI